MDSQPHYSEDGGGWGGGAGGETPLQPSPAELTQHSVLSHLDEVLFDLDSPGQGLYIRGLHLQLFLLRGHNRLESSELPLGKEEKSVRDFRKPTPHCKLLPRFSHWGYPHNIGGPKPSVRGSPTVSCKQGRSAQVPSQAHPAFPFLLCH